MQHYVEEARRAVLITIIRPWNIWRCHNTSWPKEMQLCKSDMPE